MALVSVVLIGGCTGEKTLSPAGPAALIDDDYGSIAGTVLTEEFDPVRGARVELDDGDRWTLTSTEGGFRFGSVAPGSYTVRAVVANATSPTRQVVVSAGETASAQIVLRVEGASENVPYQVTTILRGFMACNASGRPCPGTPTDRDKQSFDHEFAWRPAGLLYEVVWEANVPDEVGRWQLEVHHEKYEPNALVTSLPTPPPYLRVPFEDTPSELQKIPASPVKVHVRTFRQSYENLAGVAYEQAFDVYMTAFYVKDLSREFRAAPE